MPASMAEETDTPILLQGYEGILRGDRIPRIIPWSVLRTWNKMKLNVELMLEKELKKRGKNLRIMDLGCECGFDIFVFATRFKKYTPTFVGVDIDPNKIVVANQRAVDWEFPNCTFHAGNAEYLEFDPSSFDIILCSEVMEHLYKPKKTLKDFHTILKPGGCLIMTTPNPDNKMGGLVPPGFRKKWSKWTGEKGVVEATGDEPHDYVHHIGERGVEVWVQMLKENGFKPLELRRCDFIYGSEHFDRRPMLMGLSILLDSVLDKITYNYSWDVAIRAKRLR